MGNCEKKIFVDDFCLSKENTLLEFFVEVEKMRWRREYLPELNARKVQTFQQKNLPSFEWRKLRGET